MDEILSNNVIITSAAIFAVLVTGWIQGRPIIQWVRAGRPEVKKKARFRKKLAFELIALVGIIIFGNMVAYSVVPTVSLLMIFISLLFMVVASCFLYVYAKATVALKDHSLHHRSS